MSDPLQNNRTIAATTPLGPNKLLLRSFSYRDALSAPFSLQADLLSQETKLDFSKILGHPLSIRMNLASGKPRFFHGIVAELHQQDREIETAVFRATVVPALWHLKNVSDCKIFKNLSVPEIVSQVAAKNIDIELELSDTYAPLEYCVQYRETHYNFISRLLEKAGIAYHFRHEENRHVLVLTDSVSKYQSFPGYETIRYREAEGTHTLMECIGDWTVQQSARSVRYAHGDFNFLKPTENLRVQALIEREHGLASFEQFDYPGEYLEGCVGQKIARIRIEELQAQHETVSGSASCRGLAVGYVFTLEEHPRVDQQRKYLITGLDLRFDAGGFSTGNGHSSADNGEDTFVCAFTAMPAANQYRPERRTPRTLISGPQTAIVTGPPGEEIHTDEHGRVTVQFHWDRHGKSDADSSCWIRVSQLWAGSGWGALHLPRVGQEVIVEFLEGDPDRPIITGRVYNGDSKPPYDLPANKNISTIKSSSTKGGVGFNEIKIDDTKGSELFAIQAEKDRTLLIKNDNTEKIQHDESINVGNNRKKDVAKDETVTIGENDTIKIGKKLSVDVGEEISLVCGSASITMKKNGTIEISGVNVTMTSGGGKVNINAGGIITIKGPMVKIN